MTKTATINDDEILEGMRGNAAERRQVLAYFFANPDLMQWTLRYVGMHGGTKQDGKDVFEEAFIIFERQLRTGHFRGESSLKTWFHGLVRWQWLATQRKNHPTTDTELAALVSPHPNPEKLLIESERRVILERFLVLVGERCQKLLGYFQLNYSMREIRDLAGYSSNQVAANEVHGCREKLKKLIEQDPESMEALKNQLKR